jgi:hypothetical protein
LTRLRCGKWIDIDQGVKSGQNFLGRPLVFGMAAIRNRSALPFPSALRSDIEPVGSRAQLFANHCTLRFTLNVYCKFCNAFAVTVCDLSQIADTRAAAFCEKTLFGYGQLIKEFEKRFHGYYFSSC